MFLPFCWIPKGMFGRVPKVVACFATREIMVGGLMKPLAKLAAQMFLLFVKIRIRGYGLERLIMVFVCGTAYDGLVFP